MPLDLDRARARLGAHTPAMVPRGEHTKLAAVALVLREGPRDVGSQAGSHVGSQVGAHARPLEVLLIKRAERQHDPWSGHVAFPGGRHDAADASLYETAVREAREEVGLCLDRAEHLGRLDDLQAVARARLVDLVIEPHVFFVAHDEPLALRAAEVEEALWVPLEPMLTGASLTTRPYVHEGRSFEMPGYFVGDHVVWGLTHRMLESFLDLVRA